jgi:hypothetical protein
MAAERIEFGDNGEPQWAGMGDYVLISPDRAHRMDLIYEGEPPHGDSYHRASIDGVSFPGLVWGCMFAFSTCSRYLVLSWMSKLIERKTAVVDLAERRYNVLPEYIYDFQVRWPSIQGARSSEGKHYTFNGSEQWVAY